LFHLLALVAVTAFSVNVFAQPATPGQAANAIKITKITGTVNILKDGVVVMTLMPGDAIPELTDNKVTFAIIDGTVEVEAGGKKISGATGSNFTVTSNPGQVNVALGAGTPVAVKTETGNNLIMTANSEVKMVNTDGTVNVSMEKGTAVMTNASGGETRTLQVGQEISLSSTPTVNPVVAAPITPVTEEAAPTGEAFTVPVITEPPPSSVIPTQEVLEATEVSASNP